jgi:hypothetical protein
MAKLWFKAKNYGWGWYPVSWEGWATILIFVVFATLLATLLTHVTVFRMIAYFAGLIGSVSLLIGICLKKGEKPEWRWGKKK